MKYNNFKNNNHAIRIRFNDYGSTFKSILENLCDGISINQQFNGYQTIIIEDYEILTIPDQKLVDKIISQLSGKHVIYDWHYVWLMIIIINDNLNNT